MRTAAPVLPGSSHALESPVDRALSLLFAEERDAALRWAAAIVKHDPTSPAGLLVSGRLLGDLGRKEVGREACTVAMGRAMDRSDLPLAVAAAREIERLGGDATRALDEIAAAFSKGSPRLGEGAPRPEPLPPAESFQPISAVLTGAALLNKATEIVHEANRLLADSPRPSIAPAPLFSSLGPAGLRALCATMAAAWLPEGTRVVEQGSTGVEAYFVARGELHAQRDHAGSTRILPRLMSGDVFGEVALLSRSPRFASVVTARPSIVLRAYKDAIDAAAEEHPEVGLEMSVFAAHRMVESLSHISELFGMIRDEGRAALVARCKPELFDKGDRLLSRGAAAKGVFILASGEVSVVGRDEASGEPLIEGTLGPGDVAGEDSLVLRRPMDADVMAVHPTVTLFLSAAAFQEVMEEHAEVLVALYRLAVRRDEEVEAIQQEEASVVDDSALEVV